MLEKLLGKDMQLMIKLRIKFFTVTISVDISLPQGVASEKKVKTFFSFGSYCGGVLLGLINPSP